MPTDIPTGRDELRAALELIARAIAPAIARAVVDELRASDDEWLDQKSSPLGARRHCAAIRSGELPGRRIGRRYLAKRDDVEAYVKQQAKKPRKAKADDDADLDELAREIGLRVVGGGRR
jgi:hypothetical protein